MSSELENVEENVSSEDESGKEDVEEKAKVASPKKEEKISKENSKKSPVKKPKQEEEAEGEEEENEDVNISKNETDEESETEEKDVEPKLGLLDQPVEISGSRERKKVQRLELSFNTPSKEKHEIPEGSGEKLGECPRIEFQLQKTKTEELKVLHRILFHRPGSGNEIRKNLRRFSGFTFAKDSPEFEKKKNNLEKLTMPVLKRMCEVLDLERSGTKEDITIRILEFLLSPKPSGKSVPGTKKKSVKGERGKTKSEKEKSERKKSPKKKEESSSEEEKDEEDYSDENENAEEENNEEQNFEADDDEEENDDDDDDYEAERKQKRKTNQARDKRKRETKSKKSEDKKSKAGTKKSKKASVTTSSEEEGSDDEPLAKKTKAPPDDEEIKQLVKEILDGANLEEITMKKVIKQVFDKYPEFDLGDKKDFIKSTVRSLIS